MLTYLHVKNIALIDEFEVDFGKGFNIMTGETGAGKSIIIGSINAVLGQKVPKDFIRKDEEHAWIELIFQVSSKAVLEQLRQKDIEIEEELIISRKISQNGRSIFKLNGQVVNASDVREITQLLIDLHSQHEHQSLLEKKNHLMLLDKFLGPQVTYILEALRMKHKQYLQLKSEIKENALDDEVRKREISFLEFEINEIEHLNLTVGEDEELEHIYKKQSNIQVIQSTLSSIQNLISDQDYCVASQMSKALEMLTQIKHFDSSLIKFSGQLEEIDYLITDVIHDIINYTDDLYVDQEVLLETRRRIDLINQLRMKHGNKIEDILLALESKIDKMNQLINFEQRVKEIKKALIGLEIDMSNLSKQLSEIRLQGAKNLSIKISEALQDLNMQNTDFSIQVLQNEGFSAHGWDDVEFLISTNKSEDLKPLIQIASGGELSRVMLAIKSVLADCDEISTLIFDEIDNGISGRTAQMVAEKMVRLSKARQLICITHLPQIAAMADHHYLIEKTDSNERTITNMVQLKDEDIPNELARLIGGAKITDVVKASAVEMKELANNLKL